MASDLITHIFEHHGVLLQVNYFPGDVPTFRSVFVLDGNYRPVGPNLVGMLHDVMVMTSHDEAETFLSHIVTELV